MSDDDVRVSIRLPKVVADLLTKAADDRVVGVSLLATKLIEYGLANLPEPSWPRPKGGMATSGVEGSKAEG